jgi:hypothetical protein
MNMPAHITMKPSHGVGDRLGIAAETGGLVMMVFLRIPATSVKFAGSPGTCLA